VIVSVLLSVTFACGLFIALAHVFNKRFIAPTYDVGANLTACGSATAASMLLGNWWLILARRTFRARVAVSETLELDH